MNYLMRKPFGKTTTTKGINLGKWGFQRNANYYRVNIWDFGGQEIQSTVHQFFLTQETLYVIVLNARQYAEFAERYFEQIKSFAPNCPIIAVINRIEENPSARIDENRLKGSYRSKTGIPLLKSVHKISLLESEKNKD